MWKPSEHCPGHASNLFECYFDGFGKCGKVWLAVLIASLGGLALPIALGAAFR
jgi:hypothetical protein